MMETEKDLAYVTSSVLNIIRIPLKNSLQLLSRCRDHWRLYNEFSHKTLLLVEPLSQKPLNRTTVIEDFKLTVNELQNEVMTLQELLQISLKSIMRIFRIGNYLQQNVHHHHHYFNPNQPSCSPTAAAANHQSSVHIGHSSSSYQFGYVLPTASVTRANSPRQGIQHDSVSNGTLLGKVGSTPTSLSSTQLKRFQTQRSSNYHNNNMILWNSDDNLHKLHAIVHKYQSHCSLTCFQHEYYILHKNKTRLFTHSDIILLMLMLILNYAKSTDHRCDIGITLQMSDHLERDFCAMKRQGTLELDIRLTDLLLATEGKRKHSSSNSPTPVARSDRTSNALITAGKEDFSSLIEDVNSTISYSASSRISRHPPLLKDESYGPAREIEEFDHNMLLTALNLVQWISGEIKVEAIEIPNERNDFKLITRFLIKIPCFEKTLVDDEDIGGGDELDRNIKAATKNKKYIGPDAPVLKLPTSIVSGVGVFTATILRSFHRWLQAMSCSSSSPRHFADEASVVPGYDVDRDDSTTVTPEHPNRMFLFHKQHSVLEPLSLSSKSKPVNQKMAGETTTGMKSLLWSASSEKLVRR